MNRTKVLLIFGGESSEHDVSVSSARNVYNALDDEKYDICGGYIDRKGKWWLLENSLDTQEQDMEQLVPVPGSGYFLTLPHKSKYQPDVILPILHGKNGEDGSIAALAQLLHIPAVGCDMTAGAVCMDKVVTKQVVSAHGIPVVPYVVCRKGSASLGYGVISEKLGETLFVKPSRSGSSVGVSKVTNPEEFEIALEEAYRHDETALIEAAITAREIEVSVLGTAPHHKVSVPGEITPDAEFYDYNSKYSPSSTSAVTIPADLTEEQQRIIKAYASTAFEALGCRGLARVDFFLASDGSIYLNEVNTMPGFTDISMYPKLWQYEGISYSQLIDDLIADALD